MRPFGEVRRSRSSSSSRSVGRNSDVAIGSRARLIARPLGRPAGRAVPAGTARGARGRWWRRRRARRRAPSGAPGGARLPGRAAPARRAGTAGRALPGPSRRAPYAGGAGTGRVTPGRRRVGHAWLRHPRLVVIHRHRPRYPGTGRASRSGRVVLCTKGGDLRHPCRSRPRGGRPGGTPYEHDRRPRARAHDGHMTWPRVQRSRPTPRTAGLFHPGSPWSIAECDHRLQRNATAITVRVYHDTDRGLGHAPGSPKTCPRPRRRSVMDVHPRRPGLLAGAASIATRPSPPPRSRGSPRWCTASPGPTARAPCASRR